MPKRDLIRRIDEYDGVNPIIVDLSGRARGGGAPDWSSQIYWLISVVNFLKIRSVNAGVGLTSDGKTFETGNPTLILDPPDDSGHQTSSVAVEDGHSHWIVSYEDVSAETGTPNQILAPDASGIGKVSEIIAHINLESPLWVSYDTVNTDTRVSPTQHHYLDPGSGFELPYTDVGVSVGRYDHKFRQAAFARGAFGVLPSDSMQTGIAGTLRSTGGGVTFLTRDIANKDTTTIYVNDQAYENGEWAILHAINYIDSVRTEQIEVVKFTDGGTLEAEGDYSYAVTRAEYGEIGDVVQGTGGGASFDQSNNFDTWYYSYQPSNNPFLPGIPSSGGSVVGGWHAGDGVVSLGSAIGDGLQEWTSQDFVEGGAGPGFVGWRRTGTSNWNDLVPYFLAGNVNGYGDYTTDELGVGMAVDLSLDPDGSEFIGFLADSTKARMSNVFSRWYNAVNDEIISISVLAGFKLGTNVQVAATTVLDFDPDTGDMLVGRSATDRLVWTDSAETMQFLGLLTASRYTYQKMLDIGSASVPNGEVDGVNIFWDDTLQEVRVKLDDGSYMNLTNAESLDDLTDVVISSPVENDIVYYNGSTWINSQGRRLNTKTAISTTIVSGVLDIDGVDKVHGLIDMQGEGTANDDLVSISGGQVGDIICLITEDVALYGEITVKNTGNIHLLADEAFTSNTNSLWIGLTGAGWLPLYGSGAGSVSSLADLSDVDLTGLADNDVIQYDSVSGDFLPISPILSWLEDVDLTGLADNDGIQYDLASDKWYPTALVEELNDLTDVDLTGLVSDDILIYNGGLGVFEPLSFTLNHLVDTNLIGLLDQDILVYDDFNSVFEPLALTLNFLSNVNLVGLSDDEVIQYDSASGDWLPISPTLMWLEDVGVGSGILGGYLLAYNDIAGEWQPIAPTETLDDLSDVTTTTPTAGQLLAHNGTKFVNTYTHRQNIGSRIDITIVGGVATISGSPLGGYFNIRGEGGLADDLDTISGGNAGDIIYLTAANEIITAKDGVGNIITDTDRTLNNVVDVLGLIYDGATWIEMTFTSSA